ncbi:frizzled-2-like [Contarinia nasturtii]|uniref:frizzled-2-like n=1 Tax=Contarinia nasturtii TaxID=265458 RepID=UPI0012D3EDBF|nr:frizzled-2-like [Contarinia nasturtii]
MINYYTILQISFALMCVYASNEQKCEVITSWICENISYNFTSFPNVMNHQTQRDVHHKLINSQYHMLMDTKCSQHIRLFMCSVYMPNCIENYEKLLKPCRSFCQRTYDECVSDWIDLGLGSDWPAEMQCEQFPDETMEICLNPDNSEEIRLTNETRTNKHVHVSDKIYFVLIWIKLWSMVCVICTVATLTSTITSKQRDKPIIFLQICSLLIAVGFLFGGYLPCNITFIVIYCFGMASWIWWVILSFTWLLEAGFKWSDQSIDKYQHFFHLAWLIPIAQTILVFFSENIDSDLFTGICSVDTLSMENQKLFVIIPSFTYFLLGIALLSAGLILQANGTRKTTSMRRFNISVLYMVPALIFIGCQLFEFNNEQSKTNVTLFWIILMKHLMTFSFGILFSFGIWIERTFSSCQHFQPNAFTYDLIYTTINNDSK